MHKRKITLLGNSLRSLKTSGSAQNVAAMDTNFWDEALDLKQAHESIFF